MAGLPESDLELLTLRKAGLNGVQIAAQFGVEPEAVYMRFAAMGIHQKGAKSPVAQALPWDVVNHPDKRRITNQAPFRGLRYFLQKQMGEKLSYRAELDLKAFLNRVRAGEVLELSEEAGGFRYVPREPRDGHLVVRWPDGVPRGESVALFVDDKPAEPSAQG
ncbi:hypothetical protein [Streptomyces sp. NPDC004682]